MLQENIDKYKKVRETIDGGLTLGEALKHHGMSAGTYYAARGHVKKADKAIKKQKKTTKQAFMDLTLVPGGTDVFVIACRPDQLKKVVENLK